MCVVNPPSATVLELKETTKQGQKSPLAQHSPLSSLLEVPVPTNSLPKSQITHL